MSKRKVQVVHLLEVCCCCVVNCPDTLFCQGHDVCFVLEDEFMGGVKRLGT